MNKTSLLIIISLFVWNISGLSQEKMDIDGALIIGNSEDPTPTPGTIRWTGLNFEGWNGFIWVSLTSFQVTQIIMDEDGNEYRTVTIGGLEWLAENLRTTKYSNGDAIPNVTNNTDWGNLGSGAYCWYDNDNNYEQPYGKLYNWYAVDDARGLCPEGWHVPTDAEWTTLTDFLGGGSVAGGPMKETGTAHWNSPNFGATNSSGFSGLPGGVRSINGSFLIIGNSGNWWSSTESGSSAWYRFLSYNIGYVIQDNVNKGFGFSVRCVRDD